VVATSHHRHDLSEIGFLAPEAWFRRLEQSHGACIPFLTSRGVDFLMRNPL
jgi:hypothetical protein